MQPGWCGLGWRGRCQCRSSNSGRGVFVTRTAYGIASLSATGDGATMLDWSNMQRERLVSEGLTDVPGQEKSVS